MIITGIQNHGTIVTVWMGDEPGQMVTPVHFDHRAFTWMVEDQPGGIQDLVHRPAVVDPDGNLILDQEVAS